MPRSHLRKKSAREFLQCSLQRSERKTCRPLPKNAAEAAQTASRPVVSLALSRTLTVSSHPYNADTIVFARGLRHITLTPVPTPVLPSPVTPFRRNNEPTTTSCSSLKGRQHRFTNSPALPHRRAVPARRIIPSPLEQPPSTLDPSVSFQLASLVRPDP